MTVLAIGISSHAAILMVNNNVPAPSGTYATLQLAFDAASAGDTLLLTPSEAEYAGITVTKPVHIIGNGWARPSNTLPNTRTTGFIFDAGCAGATLTGCQVNGDITVNAGNVTIRRNKANSLRINAGCGNVSILQNFFVSGRNAQDQQGGAVVHIAENTTVSFLNNIVVNTADRYNAYSSVYYYPYGLVVKYPSSCILAQNIIRSKYNGLILNTSGSSYITQTVTGNIVLEGVVSGVSGCYNNISNGTQFPASDGNLQNINMNSLFMDLTNYDFHLAASSPAIGAGHNGTDCGIYGGDLGFVDKGIPGLPYIYFLDVPAVASKKEGLRITVKAKSGN